MAKNISLFGSITRCIKKTAVRATDGIDIGGAMVVDLLKAGKLTSGQFLFNTAREIATEIKQAENEMSDEEKSAVTALLDSLNSSD